MPFWFWHSPPFLGATIGFYICAMPLPGDQPLGRGGLMSSARIASLLTDGPKVACTCYEVSRFISGHTEKVTKQCHYYALTFDSRGSFFF